MYPKSVSSLIECFKDLPGIGEKSAERLAFAMLGFDKDRLTTFATAISDVRDKIRRCSVCNNISETAVCPICGNNNRKKDMIFVVEKPKDVALFERLGVYNGLYHVLDGLISPLEGINPDDINIKSLLDRVKNNDVSEIILALKPSIEGETTMQYIKKILENEKVKVSKIATGVPIGTDIEYIDTMTLEMALEERKDIS